jgi:hypothetical protein
MDIFLEIQSSHNYKSMIMDDPRGKKGDGEGERNRSFIRPAGGSGPHVPPIQPEPGIYAATANGQDMVDRAAEPVKLTHDMMHRDKQEDRRRMKP